MRALVVGGTGFIGLNLVDALQREGHDVVAGRRASSNTIFARRLGVPLVSCDLADLEGLSRSMDGRDTVFFAAGHYPRYSVDTAQQVDDAVRALRTALEAARAAGVGRFVYTGSVVTIGAPTPGALGRETDGTSVAPPGSTYFEVKLALEAEALAARDIDVVVTCPTGCLGPYDHKVGTGSFVVGMATQGFDHWVDGNVNIVDVRDVARGHLLAAQAGRPGQRYILGGHNLTVGELIDRIASRFGLPRAPGPLDERDALAFALEEEARCLPRRERPRLTREMVDVVTHGQFVDSSRAMTELGFVARPLDETLDASFDWYRRNGYIAPTVQEETTA